MGDTKLGQGESNARIFFENNKDIAAAVESQIRKKYNIELASSELDEY